MLFIYRLALALGSTVEELKDRMSAKELAGWVAYYNVEPWGAKIDGLRQGFTASTIFNTVASAVGGQSGNKDYTKFTIGVKHPKPEARTGLDEQSKINIANLENLVREARKNVHNRPTNRRS